VRRTGVVGAVPLTSFRSSPQHQKQQLLPRTRLGRWLPKTNFLPVVTRWYQWWSGLLLAWHAVVILRWVSTASGRTGLLMHAIAL